MKLRFLFAACVLFVSFAPFCSAGERVSYVNPVSPWDAEPWDDYGFGDPFVMRYNGRYYLYPSTRDDSIGVKCWSSRDLVNWKYEGLCTEEPTSKGAYAPEVYRGDDAFYMTTSPAGKGHYIYRSESPTGPFVLETGNFGLSIDGSVFIDDAGDGYFYSASDRGILAYRMTSPTQVEPKPIEIGAFMDGWTEGPSVFKHDGVYFTTYTGNHVFSRGYRIDAGSGATPTNFTRENANPVLVSTEGDLFGIGHNSIVKGPNLDLYYIVYHSLKGRGKTRGWPVRETNIDRLVLDRETLLAAGPTTTKQEIAMPDEAVWFDAKEKLGRVKRFVVGQYGPRAMRLPTDYKDGFVTLDKEQALTIDSTFDGDFTAEFNLGLTSDSGTPGVLFCYKDFKNYGMFKLKPKDRIIEIVTVRKGEEERTTAAFPTLFGKALSFEVPRAIQIERAGNEFTFYVDDRFVTKTTRDLSGGAIGYYAKGGSARCGFFGGTRAVGGRSVARQTEPVPGRIALGLRKSQDAAARENAVLDGKERSVLPIAAEDYVELELNAAKGGLYDVGIRYGAADKASCALTFGKGKSYSLALEATTNVEGGFATAIVRKVKLPSGKSKLRISCEEGRVRLADAVFAESAAYRAGQSMRFDKPSYVDGEWLTSNGGLTTDGDSYGKALYGERGMGDYKVETKLTFGDDRRLACVLVRASEPAKGGPDNSPRLGVDFLKGYGVTFDGNVVALEKFSYGRTRLAESRFSTDRKSSVDVRVDALGDALVVYLNGEEVLRYKDADPILCGRPGVRAFGGEFSVEKFRAEPLNAK